MMRDIKTREGFEFWDKLNALPRYAFLLSPSGKSVQKFEDQAMGNWIDVHEAQKVVDHAQDEINQFRAERDALNQRLTESDQRADDLQAQLEELEQRRRAEFEAGQAAERRVEVLEKALKFYAEGEHYHFESGNWDTVSGEPLNILWCGDEPDFIEDGTVARAAINPASEATCHE